MARVLISFILLLCWSLVSQAEWDPAKASLVSATQRMRQIEKPGEDCRNRNDCAKLNFIQKLETEDYGSKFFGLLKSRAPSCQIAVDKMRSPKIVSRFTSSGDMQKHFAAMFPEIGAVNHQRIGSCSQADDPSSRYRVAKFYHYMKRFNTGATRAVEELSAINSLLGDNNPLPCEGKGVIDQAYNRCLALQKQCSGGKGALSEVAAQSVEDEKMYEAAKAQIKKIDDTCLRNAKSYELYGKELSATKKETFHCKSMGKGEQYCETFTWEIKSQMAVCSFAKQNLQATMAALEDTNPWFRSENYFQLRKSNTVEESIRKQSLINRVELKKKVREFRDAGLCVNGFRSSQNCDMDEVRSLLAATPEIPERLGANQKNNAAYMYLGAQSCIEEGVRDQAETAKVLNGLARDAALTIVTAGLSGIAVGAKAAITAGRAMSTLRYGALAGVAGVDALYASESYKQAINQCSGKVTQKLAVAAQNMGKECPGPKSNLAQAQREHTNCAASIGFAALDSLPGVPLLAATNKYVRQSITVSDAAAASLRATKAAGGKVADATRSAVAKVTGKPAAPPVAAKAPAASRASAPAGKASSEVAANSAPAVTSKKLDVATTRAAATQIQSGRNSAKIENFKNSKLDSASVVRSVDGKIATTRSDIKGINNDGIEILDVDGKQLFAKVVNSRPGMESDSFLNEIFFAKKIDELGLGPKFHGVTTGKDGKYRIVSDMIDGSDIKVYKSGKAEIIEGDISKITDQTIRDMREINQKLVASGINPLDLQFRVDKNGKPYVVDTEKFMPIRQGKEAEIAKTLEDQIKVLERNRKKLPKSTEALAVPNRVEEVATSTLTNPPAPPSAPKQSSSPTAVPTSEVASPATVMPSASGKTNPSFSSERSEFSSTGITPKSSSGPISANSISSNARKDLIEVYSGRKITTEAQNRDWIRRGSKVEPDGKSKFLVIENSQMKELNDISLDKDLVTGLTNKRLEMTHDAVNDLLKKYPQVESVPYSDFKSVRYAFSPKPPATKLPDDFEAQLQKVYQQTNDQFADFIRSNGLQGKLGDPANWFHGGTGKTGDQASYAARQSRGQASNALNDFDNAGTQQRLSQNLTRTEGMRQNLANDPGLAPLMDASKGRTSLKTEVFEILRKTNDPSQVQKQIAKSLGIKVDEKQAQRMIAYADSVDGFSPSINVPLRESSSLTPAENGGISLDFKGIGAKNMKETAEAVASSKTGSRAIEESRLGESGVTASFASSKMEINKTLQEIAEKNGYKFTIRSSGDDMVILPDKPFTTQVKQQISEALARKVPPSSLRLSSIPAGVQQSERAALGVLGEDIEKRLRQKLQGQIPRERLDKILFSVDMGLDKTKGISSDLRTSSNNMAISDEEMRKIRTAFDNAVRESGAKKTIEQLNQSANLTPQQKARAFEEINDLPEGYISGSPEKVAALERIENQYQTPVSTTSGRGRTRDQKEALVAKRNELRRLGMTDQQIQRGMDQGIFGAPATSNVVSAYAAKTPRSLSEVNSFSSPGARYQPVDVSKAAKASAPKSELDAFKSVGTQAGSTKYSEMTVNGEKIEVFTKVLPRQKRGFVAQGSKIRSEAEVAKEAHMTRLMSDLGYGPRYLDSKALPTGDFEISTEYVKGLDFNMNSRNFETKVQNVTMNQLEQAEKIALDLNARGIYSKDLQFMTTDDKVLVIDPERFEFMTDQKRLVGRRESILSEFKDLKEARRRWEASQASTAAVQAAPAKAADSAVSNKSVLSAPPSLTPAAPSAARSMNAAPASRSAAGNGSKDVAFVGSPQNIRKTASSPSSAASKAQQQRVGDYFSGQASKSKKLDLENQYRSAVFETTPSRALDPDVEINGFVFKGDDRTEIFRITKSPNGPVIVKKTPDGDVVADFTPELFMELKKNNYFKGMPNDAQAELYNIGALGLRDRLRSMGVDVVERIEPRALGANGSAKSNPFSEYYSLEVTNGNDVLSNFQKKFKYSDGEATKVLYNPAALAQRNALGEFHPDSRSIFLSDSGVFHSGSKLDLTGLHEVSHAKNHIKQETSLAGSFTSFDAKANPLHREAYTEYFSLDEIETHKKQLTASLTDAERKMQQTGKVDADQLKFIDTNIARIQEAAQKSPERLANIAARADTGIVRVRNSKPSSLTRQEIADEIKAHPENILLIESKVGNETRVEAIVTTIENQKVVGMYQVPISGKNLSDDAVRKEIVARTKASMETIRTEAKNLSRQESRADALRGQSSAAPIPSNSAGARSETAAPSGISQSSAGSSGYSPSVNKGGVKTSSQKAQEEYKRYTEMLTSTQNRYPSSANEVRLQQRDLATQNRLAAQAAEQLNRQAPNSVSSSTVTGYWKSAASAQEKYLAQELKANYKTGPTKDFFSRYSSAIYSKEPGLGFDAKKFYEQAGQYSELQRRFDTAFDFHMRAGNPEKAKEIIEKSPLFQNTTYNDYFNKIYLPHYKANGTAVGVSGL